MLKKVKIKFIPSSDISRQEFTTSDNRGQKADENNDTLRLSLLTAKTIDGFEERLEWMSIPICYGSKKLPETT